MELDLHGLSVEEATAKISISLWSFKQDDYESKLLVITGRGLGDMQTTFLNMIDEEWDLNCEEINSGSYIVTKNK